jgi:GGDEF domain-containing protein
MGRVIIMHTHILITSQKRLPVKSRKPGIGLLIVLGSCGNGCIEARAEAIRAAIANDVFWIEGAPLSVTMSIGAYIYDLWEANPPIESFLAQADAALYQAKSEGRNKVVFAKQLVNA